MTGRTWILVAGLFVLALAVTVGVLLATRAVLRRRLRMWARNSLWRFRARVDRYKLVERDRIREALLQDPVVLSAIEAHVALHGAAESQVRIRVNQYIDEIIPFFNVLSYYRIGYNLARLTIDRKSVV